MHTFTDTELDALREVANIGSGNAATALSAMLGLPVDISVPSAAAVPLAQAIAAVGEPGDLRHGVVVGIVGDMDAVVVLLFPDEDARRLCGVYGIDPSTDDGRSMLGEVGNILGTNYVNVLGQMVGMELEPTPPQVVEDMLGAIMQTVLLGNGEAPETALILDSRLMVEVQECSLSFLLLPSADGIRELMTRLGI